MYRLSTRGRLIGIIGTILVIGFAAVNFANYRVSSRSVREALIHNELPLISNNIYSEIQAGLLRPIYISSLMANDTFLKDWMLGGEQDVAKVTKYLQEIRKRYAVSSTFVVSANTLRYYYFDGVLKKVSPKVPKDNWFFTMKDYPKNYRVDVDYNEARRNQLTIFVNHKLFDYDGKFIGVTGLGLDIANVSHMIERYRNEFHRSVYFVDRDGVIKSHHDHTLIDHASIRTLPGIAQVADELLANDSGFLTYRRGSETILLTYRFIPELNWYLLVEQSEGDALAPIRHALYLNLTIGGAITLLVLLISAYTINRFQSRLERMARTDKLTGLINRQYFDVIYQHAIRRMERIDAPLSLAIFDIDNLKPINDRHGHMEGDRVISAVAQIAQAQVRASDVVSRWGGDEFTLLFPDCDETAAQAIVEKIHRRIVEQLGQGSDGIEVSISAGVAQYHPGDDAASLLVRADRRLYTAKRQGKSQVLGAASDTPPEPQ